MSKTAEERFMMCANMYETAKEFAKIGMPADISDEDEQAYIFKRLHGRSPQEIIQTEYL